LVGIEVGGNERASDFGGLCLMSCANKGSENISCRLTATSVIEASRGGSEVDSDVLQWVVFELLNFMFTKGYVWNNYSLDNGPDGVSRREKRSIVT
jgi:hypothetical protein